MEEDVRAALLNRYYKDSESLQLQEFVSEALDNSLTCMKTSTISGIFDAAFPVLTN